MIYNKMQRKDIKSMFFPSNKPSALEQPCQGFQIIISSFPYFKTIISLQRVVGFLLLKSCLMALAKTLAFPLPSF
jgi:hypothetical protein